MAWTLLIPRVVSGGGGGGRGGRGLMLKERVGVHLSKRTAKRYDVCLVQLPFDEWVYDFPFDF